MLHRVDVHAHDVKMVADGEREQHRVVLEERLGDLLVRVLQLGGPVRVAQDALPRVRDKAVNRLGEGL